ENPEKGINYYRIKLAKTGSVKYSNIQAINFAGVVEGGIYPNPASSELTVTLKNNTTKNLTVSMYSQNGHLLLKKNYQTQNTNSVIQLNGLNRFANGAYFIKVSDGNNTIYQQKIILSH
ncbi:MAG: T9SS type A sorting domain-containing protein, partial [Chitinophagaceae bacterium]